MPRKPLQVSQKLEYLSILDENAQVDKELEPKLDAKELKTLFRYMLLARRFDERLLLLQRQGRIGTFPQAAGHEAISMGSAFCIQKSDWHVPAYRELAGLLHRGWPLETILLYWHGYEEGAKPPEGVNDLPICVPLASQLPHAVGLGMANNIKKDKNVVLTYFGDGASSEGDCHEAMNFASVFKAPVVFICLNNQYAISVPLSKQMNCETIAQRAVSYGIPGIRVDGNDVLAVYAATKEAVDRARRGEGPTLVEGLTYRFTPHTTADDPKRYRKDAEVETWMKREPLIRFSKYLEDKGIVTAADRAKLEEELDAQIKAAVTNVEAMLKTEEISTPLAMFDNLYADIPPFLQEQRDEVQERTKPKKAKSDPSTSGRANAMPRH